MNAAPEFLDAADPTIYGFGYESEGGGAPLFSTASWGSAESGGDLAGLGGALPSSDGPVIRSSEIGSGALQAAHQQAQQQAQHAAQHAAQQHAEQAPQPGRARIVPDYGQLAIETDPTAVLPAHAVPGYPWQGHHVGPTGPQARFWGPDNTTPMGRGGPNVGAYAVAPSWPHTIDGAAYTAFVPGPAVPRRGMSPTIGGYAGLDFAGAEERQARRAGRREARSAALTQRDVRGEGGFVYRQFADGSLVVLVSGEPQVIPANTRIPRTSTRWHAVTNEIGTWEEYVGGQRANRIQALTDLATGAAQAVGGGRRGRGQGGGRAAAPAEPVVEESAGLPGWVPVLGVIAVGGILIAVLSRPSRANGKAKATRRGKR
jgi:hypothetical protein